jgi:hypothetical protein
MLREEAMGKLISIPLIGILTSLEGQSHKIFDLWFLK